MDAAVRPASVRRRWFVWLYRCVVHSTNNVSSTLYEWQGADRGPSPTASRRRDHGRAPSPRRSRAQGGAARPRHGPSRAGGGQGWRPRRDQIDSMSRRGSARSTSGPGPSRRPAGPASPATRSPPPPCASPTPRASTPLSMRRLAAELDAGTMTLYHYVRTKDELLTLRHRRGDGRGRRARRTSCPPTGAARDHAHRQPLPRRAGAAPVDPRHRRRSAARAPTACATSTSRCRPSSSLDVAARREARHRHRRRRVRLRLLPVASGRTPATATRPSWSPSSSATWTG